MRPRLAAYGVDMNRVHLVNFGVEAERFTPIAEYRPGWHAPIAEPVHQHREPLRIISLRLLDPIYDIPTLIRAAGRLRETGVAIQVDIHGEGLLREQLQDQVRKAGLSGIVTLHGRYSHDTLPAILAGADVLVSTSTSDAGIAASTAEAMAAGLPAIISDSGENAEWIIDGVNGRLFPVGDDTALAATLVEAAADPTKRLSWAKAGQRMVLERNDYQTEMRKMDTLYAELPGAH
jgi:glycosyltransferase involved in cell wall biosynthesis